MVAGSCCSLVCYAPAAVDQWNLHLPSQSDTEFHEWLRTVEMDTDSSDNYDIDDYGGM